MDYMIEIERLKEANLKLNKKNDKLRKRNRMLRNYMKMYCDKEHFTEYLRNVMHYSESEIEDLMK